MASKDRMLKRRPIKPGPVKPQPKSGKNPQLPYRSADPGFGPKKRNPGKGNPPVDKTLPRRYDPGFGPKKPMPGKPVKPAPKGGIRDLLYRVKPGEKVQKDFKSQMMKKQMESRITTPNKENNYRTPQMSPTAMPKPKPRNPKPIGILPGVKPKPKKSPLKPRRGPGSMDPGFFPRRGPNLPKPGKPGPGEPGWIKPGPRPNNSKPTTANPNQKPLKPKGGSGRTKPVMPRRGGR